MALWGWGAWDGGGYGIHFGGCKLAGLETCEICEIVDVVDGMMKLKGCRVWVEVL